MVGELGRQRNVLKSDVKKVCSGEQRYQNKYFGETPHMVGVSRKLLISLGMFSVENSKEFFFPSPPYLLM